MRTPFKETTLGRGLARSGAWVKEAVDTHPFRSCLCVGVLMTLLIYLLHARSLIHGFSLVFSQPLYFLYNALIIVAFYPLSLFFTRRIFAMSVITVLWLAFGITNFVLLGMRVTPLEAIDFYIFRTGVAIIHVYMSVPQIVAVVVAILAVIALLVLLFIKCPRSKSNPIRNLLTVICCLLAVLLLTLAVVGIADADPKNYDNIKDAYDTYGFPYCFLRSIFERGIDEPRDYSEEQLRHILTQIAASPSEPPKAMPNVIMVQLESFFDVNRMKDVRYSENPIPNFTAMMSEGSSGMISVPGIGAGTANTEFEVLSGLDLEFFGTGEYPYATILGKRCCETIAYGLSALGYTTHSMHNHTGTFYDRYRVYANLGFDTFTPAEHMIGLEYTDLGWEKDTILTKYIMKALTSTDSPDFVFAVSVQGHGKYPEVPTTDSPAITITDAMDEDRHHAFEYYVNQLREMDAFIGELRDTLAALDEQTVLVLYGDHLPTLDITEDELVNRDLLQTDYVIWSNFPLEKSKVDLEAYQLSALILEKLGMNNGLITKVHHRFADSDRYLDILRLVGYDMLYGDRFAFGDEFPYLTRDMRIGLDDIFITDVTAAEDGRYFISGQGFTESSSIFVNGRKVDTAYVSQNLLYTDIESLDIGDLVTVVQISVDLQKLSTTEEYVIEDVIPNAIS